MDTGGQEDGDGGDGWDNDDGDWGDLEVNNALLGLHTTIVFHRTFITLQVQFEHFPNNWEKITISFY